MREISPGSPEARRLDTYVKLIAFAIAMTLSIGLQAAKHFKMEQHHVHTTHSSRAR